jgi:hypothetical protein
MIPSNFSTPHRVVARHRGEAVLELDQAAVILPRTSAAQGWPLRPILFQR